MVNRYRRMARTADELGLGALKPMDVAISDLNDSPPEASLRSESTFSDPSRFPLARRMAAKGRSATKNYNLSPVTDGVFRATGVDPTGGLR